MNDLYFYSAQGLGGLDTQGDDRKEPRSAAVPTLSRSHKVVSLCAQAEVSWMHKEVLVMGRLVPQPRLVAYQADDRGLAYTYSSLTLAPDAWSPAVLAVKVGPSADALA